MAMADTATLLWSKFLDSLSEAERSLGPLIRTKFASIARSINVLMDLNGLPTELLSGTEAGDFRRDLCEILYDLNKELAECRINEQRRLPQLQITKALRSWMRLKDIRRRISDLRDDPVGSSSHHFLEPLATDPEPSSPSPSNPFEDYASETVGLDGYEAKIQEKIFGQGVVKVGVRLIGICGMDGLGRTTLVRKIFDGETARSKFSRRVWLRFSGGAGIDADRIVKDALKALDFDLDELCDDITPSTVALWGILKSELSGKTYLIVLDNIWLVDAFSKDSGGKSSTYKKGVVPLLQGLPKGGVVVVISRPDEVARYIVGEENLVHLLPLDESNCWKIFSDAVNKEPLVESDRQTLAMIDEEIKYQCHGLPLAAKLLAKIIPKQINEMEHVS